MADELDQTDDTGIVEEEVEEIVTEPVKEPAKKPAAKKAAKAAAAAAAETTDDDDSEIVEEIDYDELQRLRADQAELKAARLKLAAAEKKAAALETENTGFKREKMSAEEKLKADAEAAQQRVTDLEAKLRTSQARIDIAEAARELKVLPRTAEKLILRDLTFDDDGKATNVRELLEAEIAADPNLVTRVVQQASAANADSNRRGAKQVTQADLASMGEEQINELFNAGKLNDLMAGKVAYITI